tara:strand:- start:139 stop:495 length:357 start_codon:yes stop_codon:yes gene_type:complete
VSGKINIFVYGTLREGEPFHHLLQGTKQLALTRTTADFRLLHLGEYPGMVDGGNTQVVGEIYEVPSSLVSILDEYEDYPLLYDRRTIRLENGTEAIAYILRLPKTDYPIIASGDWKSQ